MRCSTISGMSTVGIFILLLIAFFVLHRWYVRPQRPGPQDASGPRPWQRAAAGANPAPPATGTPAAKAHPAPIWPPAEGTAGVAGTLGAAGASAAVAATVVPARVAVVAVASGSGERQRWWRRQWQRWWQWRLRRRGLAVEGFEGFEHPASGNDGDADRQPPIRIRGARQNNLKNLDLDIPTGATGGGDRRLGQRQVIAGVRHALCRRPAALRRDLLRLCAAVPRPDGQAAGRPHRRRAAGDRDRPDQSGAHLALHRRHDDRTQRPPEVAARARLHALLPQLRAAGPARPHRQHREERARPRAACRRSAAGGHFRGRGAGQLQREPKWSSTCRHRATPGSIAAPRSRRRAAGTATPGAAARRRLGTPGRRRAGKAGNRCRRRDQRGARRGRRPVSRQHGRAPAAGRGDRGSAGARPGPDGGPPAGRRRRGPRCLALLRQFLLRRLRHRLRPADARACSPSTRRSAPARPAAASAASSASTSAW